jgi:hypothetical protein
VNGYLAEISQMAPGLMYIFALCPPSCRSVCLADSPRAMAGHAGAQRRPPLTATGAPGTAPHGHSPPSSRPTRSYFQIGYDYDAVKIFMPAGAKTPIYAPYVEHVPPDPAAGMFWLKNRQPDKWRDVQQLEHAIGKYIISDKPLSAEAWVAARAVVVDGDDAVDVTPVEQPLLSPALSNDNGKDRK